MKIERIDDLADRQALQEVKQSGEHQGAVSQRAVRQHVGNFRFNAFPAAGAVVAMDDVSGDNRVQILRNVFGKAFPGFPGAPQCLAAFGTAVQPMRACSIGLDGPFAGPSGMSGLAAPFACLSAVRSRRWLLVRGDGRRRCVRPGLSGRLSPHAGLDHQKREDNDFSGLPGKPAGLLFGDPRSQKSLDKRRVDFRVLDNPRCTVHDASSRTNLPESANTDPHQAEMVTR